jgi:hypothetical protein
MLKKAWKLAGVAVLLATLQGCASNNVVANDSNRSGQFFGDMGITGDNNVVTVEQWSRLDKLSIFGDGNEVIVEEGVVLPLVEIFGSDNIVSVPDYLLVQVNQVGHRNRIVERESEPAPAPMPVYQPRRGGYDRVRVTIENERGERTTREFAPDETTEEEIRIPPPPSLEGEIEEEHGLGTAEEITEDEVELEIAAPEMEGEPE